MAHPVDRQLITAADKKIFMSNVAGALLHRLVRQQNYSISCSATLADAANKLWKQSLLTQLPLAEQSTALQGAVSPLGYVGCLVASHVLRSQDSAEGGALTTLAKGWAVASPLASTTVVAHNSAQGLKESCKALGQRPLSALAAICVHLFNLCYELQGTATSLGLGSEAWLQAQQSMPGYSDSFLADRTLKDFPRVMGSLREPVQTMQAGQELASHFPDLQAQIRSLEGDLTYAQVIDLSGSIRNSIEKAGNLDRAIFDSSSHHGFFTRSLGITRPLVEKILTTLLDVELSFSRHLQELTKKASAVKTEEEYLHFLEEHQIYWKNLCRLMKIEMTKLKENIKGCEFLRDGKQDDVDICLKRCDSIVELVEGKHIVGFYKHMKREKTGQILDAIQSKIDAFEATDNLASARTVYDQGKKEIEEMCRQPFYKDLKEKLIARSLDEEWIGREIGRLEGEIGEDCKKFIGNDFDTAWKNWENAGGKATEEKILGQFKKSLYEGLLRLVNEKVEAFQHAENAEQARSIYERGQQEIGALCNQPIQSLPFFEEVKQQMLAKGKDEEWIVRETLNFENGTYVFCEITFLSLFDSLWNEWLKQPIIFKH